MDTEVGENEVAFTPIFEEPPPAQPRRRKSRVFTDAVVATLKENPDRWVILIAEAAVKDVTNAQNWAKRRPGFAVTSRTMQDRHKHPKPYRVYAKFDPSAVTREKAELALYKARKAAQEAPKPQPTSEGSVLAQALSI